MKMKSSPYSWESLKKGDLIDVVAPGSASVGDGLSRALLAVEDLGFHVRFSREGYGEDPFHSAQDPIRFKNLVKALKAKDSKAVMCLRGGYGANRLMMDFMKVAAPALKGKKAKLFIGYSDISSLHLWLNQKWNWPTMHGPLADSLGAGKYSTEHIKEFKSILTGEQTDVVFKNIEPLNAKASQVKKIEAPVCGGNLMVLQSSLGTPYQIQTKNKILFLEEIGERGYRVDRIFMHLQQAGALKDCKAVVLGDFLGGDEADKNNYVSLAVERFAKNVKIPVFKGIEAGHGIVNRPVFFNTDSRLEKKGSQISLSISTGVS